MFKVCTEFGSAWSVELPKYEKFVCQCTNGFLKNYVLHTKSSNSRAHNTQIYGAPFIVFSARVVKNVLSLL